MSGKNKKQNGGLQIGGNVKISHGDFVAGDKHIQVGGGGVYVGGDVWDSNVITGSQNQVSNQAAVRQELFEDLFKRIEQRPKTDPVDKEDLKLNVTEIKAEAEKGNQANESFLSVRLRNIARIAPDIAEVMLATLTNPAAGFAAVVSKIAQRAKNGAVAS